jgi:hypothetical protein
VEAGEICRRLVAQKNSEFPTMAFHLNSFCFPDVRDAINTITFTQLLSVTFTPRSSPCR